MRSIEELRSDKKYKDIVFQKKFESKKNTVVYVTLKGKPRVVKMFVPGLKRQMKNEYNILKRGSSKLNIPNVYEIDEKNNVLILSYISGENLCDFINNEEISINEKKDVIKSLARWFYDFHNFFKKEGTFYIHGDPTIRNFIVSSTDKIWGVDFEEVRQGKVVEDIAGACASILTIEPMFTSEKFEICRVLVDSYVDLAPGRILNINDEVSYAILQKIQYRPEDEKTLRKYSKQIKEKGLKYL